MSKSTRTRLHGIVLWGAMGSVIALAICSVIVMHGDNGGTPESQVVVFRLTDPATAKPLANVVVSVFDGFDRSLAPFAGPVRSNNAPYHFADIRIVSDGLLQLDLNQLKEDTILIKSGDLYKYIRHQGHMVKVLHYDRHGNTLRVKAHYDHDLNSNVVTVTRFPSEISEPPQAFTHIDVPMD